MIKRVIVVLMLIVLSAGCGDSSAARGQLDSPLARIAQRHGVPAAAAWVWDGDTVRRGNYGGNIYDGSLFCIGSVSKSFVAALALKLQEEGVLSLGDTVGQYLPDFPHWNKDSITLRDLLSMRSGIGDYTADFEREDYFREYERHELIQMGLDRSALLSRGSYSYSNTNILIARRMIEKATGRDCETLIREKILKPLKLEDTYFSGEKQDIQDRLIPGYSNTKTEKRIDFTDASGSWADLACGMYSTAADMAGWVTALICGDFLNDASKKELLDFMPATESMDYGLCVARKTLRGEQVIILQGNVPGYSSTILIQGDTVCAVLCNLSDYSGGGISYAELIAEELMFPAAIKSPAYPSAA